MPQDLATAPRSRSDRDDAPLRPPEDVIDRAENRLHTIEAVLVATLG